MSITITGGISLNGGGWTIVAPPSVATAGWYGGGSTPTQTSNVQRITFATDTATATTRGSLSVEKYNLAATGDLTNGWFAGGNPGPTSGINRITYATDTATASVRGPLSSARYGLAATGNTTDGWFGGGYSSSGSRSTVDRITYATDTATASVRGPLSSARYNMAASSGIQ